MSRPQTVCVVAALATFALLPAPGRANAGEASDLFVRVLPATPDAGAQPVPKFRILYPPATRWRVPLRWRYNPANAPTPWEGDPAGTVDAIRQALDTWTAVCNLSYVYEGMTDIPANNVVQDPRFGEQPDYVNVVAWGPLDGNKSGITWSWHGSASAGSDMMDTDIILSTTLVRTAAEMRRTMTHEWGHALGLDHSDFYGTLMSGPPLTAYNALATLQDDDVRGCRCLYGSALSSPAGYVCASPVRIDFGIVAVGVPSAPQPLTVRNEGEGPLTIISRGFTTSEVIAGAACDAGTVIPPGGSCTTSLSVRPMFATASAREGVVNLQLSDGAYNVPVSYQGTASAPLPTTTVELVEYYHAAFDHYFVTHLQDEIAKLDNGTLAGWARTGRSFKAWSGADATTSPVCRFFSDSFGLKSSHFYTSFAFECANVKQNRDWTFEGDVFHVGLPDGRGTCASGTQPVYRIYNGSQGGAPNHRFTTDPALRQTMLAQGWQPEGLGPGVTMCVPQ